MQCNTTLSDHISVTTLLLVLENNGGTETMKDNKL